MSSTSNKRKRGNINENICGVCKSEVPPDPKANVDDWVECSCCATWYHFFCVGIAFADPETNYFCPDCFKNSNLESVVIKVSKSLIDSGDLVKAIGTALETAIASHIERLWPAIEDKIQIEIKNSTAVLSQGIKDLEATVSELKKQIQFLNHQHQYNIRANNIVIRGIADNLKLEPIKFISKIAECIGYKLVSGDVMSIRKIPMAADSKGKSPIMVVSFRDNTTKYNFLKSYYSANKRKKYINMGLFKAGGTNADYGKEKIYISEHMDKLTLQIFLTARKLKRLQLISYYRLSKGIISIKINENDKFHYIRSLDQFYKLIPSALQKLKYPN